MRTAPSAEQTAGPRGPAWGRGARGAPGLVCLQWRWGAGPGRECGGGLRSHLVPPACRAGSVQGARPPPGPPGAQRSPIPAAGPGPAEPPPGLGPPVGLGPCPAPTGPGAHRPGLRHPQQCPLPAHLSPVRAEASQPQAGEVSCGLGFCTPQTHQGLPLHPVHPGPEWPAPAPPPQASVDQEPLTCLVASLGGGAAFPKPPGGGALCSRADLGKYWPPRPSAASGLGGCQPPGALPTRRELATEDVHRASSCSAGPALLTFRQDVGPAPRALGWDTRSSEHPDPARQAPALRD